MIFPSTKITIFEFFPKNHSNSGNFLYSIVDLTKILILAQNEKFSHSCEDPDSRGPTVVTICMDRRHQQHQT